MNSQVSQSTKKAILDYLAQVEIAVGNITDPKTNKPVTIPNLQTLKVAATNLEKYENPGRAAWIINTLLEDARCVDLDSPTDGYELSFPNDHAMHLTMGSEWYWIGANMKVKDNAGNVGRLSVLTTTQRCPAMGKSVRETYGISNEDASVGATPTTVTVDMPDTQAIYRRTMNVQWPLAGGKTTWSAPGEDFELTVGTDSLKGSKDVLPLNVSVNDGDSGMYIDITLDHQSFVNTDSAFFLQGMPKKNPDGTLGSGNGITGIPSPGIYYSWPQLTVEAGGTITLGEKIYTVISGEAWIDHQMIMQSLKTAKGTPNTSPFKSPDTYNGWIWQYFNSTTGDNQAWTGAGFEVGNSINTKPDLDYGYHVKPDGNGGWHSAFLMGAIQMSKPQSYPVNIGTEGGLEVTFWKDRSYELISKGFPLIAAEAAPWINDGTFNNPNGSLWDESPAELTAMVGGEVIATGYLESLGFEKVTDISNNSMKYLESIMMLHFNPPTNDSAS